MKINKCRVFPEYIENILFENSIVNWIWWEDWFSFDNFYKDNIAMVDEFLPDKWHQLYKDIRRLSVIHDIEFLVWWWKLDFYYSEYSTSKSL